MKRPAGLWILLSLGVLWITVRDVYAVRATALIFARTTTTTTAESVSSEANDTAETATVTEPTDALANGNTTKHTLTGNPQIDYIYDPNLPSTLKGYNLSDYPFYERVPDLTGLEFKCDGLHDGFYASVPHKCQVYHHCLFGTRYDFLCANYTAFDQKTFICQFVSIVDCENSKKYWHRNDDLYQVASTTTQKPLRSIYTPPPEVGDAALAPSGPDGDGRRPAAGGRRPYRPQRRRPPQLDYYEDDYYDDYVDERPRGRRKRPRPRPRPVYDDEYEEYDDERYEGRRGQGRRRPYRGDRDRPRNKGRKKPEKAEYDEDDEEVDERFEDEDFIEGAKKQKSAEDRRKPKDEEDQPEEPRERKRSKDKRRRPDDDLEPETPRKPLRKSNRRPAEEDYDETPQSDDSRSYEENSRPNKKKQESQNKDGRPIIKPVSGTIYDRPRLAPRINLPVPKNAADKFSYKNVGQSGASPKKLPKVETKVEEDYEDYEEELPPKRKKNQRNRSEDTKKDKPDLRNQASQTSKSPRKPDNQDIPEEKSERTPSKPKYGSRKYSNALRSTTTSTTTTQSSKSKPSLEEYEDEDYEIEEKEVPTPQSPFRARNKQREKSSTTSTTSSTTTTTTTTTTEAPQKEVMVRIVKRPFLPSRGGNPYSARGLQPVGIKAAQPTWVDDDSLEPSAEDTKAFQEVPIEKEPKQVFKPSPVLIKIPVRTKYTPPSAEAQEVFDSDSSRQQNYKSKDYLVQRPTQKPRRVPERNPLDLNEFDVTLNDALNPTLPNLPVRGFPTGFSNTANDYSYSAYQRPRYVQVEPVISQSNPELVYQSQPARQQQPQRYEQFPPNNQYTTINGGYRRRDTQNGQTQALYSSY